MLTEDLDLEATVKVGVAEEQAEAKAGNMSGDTESDSTRIRKLEEEIARLQFKDPAGGKKKGSGDKDCKTCPRGDLHEGRPCLGKKS